jgi:hypothetical protein
VNLSSSEVSGGQVLIPTGRLYGPSWHSPIDKLHIRRPLLRKGGKEQKWAGRQSLKKPPNPGVSYVHTALLAGFAPIWLLITDAVVLMGKKAAAKGKKAKPVKDGPKKPKSGFMFYSQERRVTLKVEQPDLSITDASKVIGAEWKALAESDKKKYMDLFEEDRKRYASEKEALAADS